MAEKREKPDYYLLPGDLERRIGTFVDHYNNHRYHESLANLTPADVYRRRGGRTLKMKERRSRSAWRQSESAGYSTEPRPVKLKPKPNKGLRYKTAREVRKNLTPDMVAIWRRDYNGSRPHSQLGWQIPAEFASTFNPRRTLALRSEKSSVPLPSTSPVQQGNTNPGNELGTG